MAPTMLRFPSKIRPAFYAILGAIATAGLLLAFDRAVPGEEPLTVKPDGRLQYKWYPPQTPASMSFAGEKVPLERWDVREALDRELLINYYSHSQSLYALKLSTRYFPMMEEKLRAAGVPEDFKYLAVAESHLQNQRSGAGAVGFWQFMSSTGPTYGLEISTDVDERYNPAKATDAACQYLRQAYNKFGSWTAAAASYNCGMGGYNGQATFQGTMNYYDLALPEETMRYVFRILALKYLIGGAQQIGFIVQGADAYKPYKTRVVPVASSITNLSEWAREQGTTYKMLKTLNPWLRSRSLAVKPGKTYNVEVPVQ